MDDREGWPTFRDYVEAAAVTLLAAGIILILGLIYGGC